MAGKIFGCYVSTDVTFQCIEVERWLFMVAALLSPTAAVFLLLRMTTNHAHGRRLWSIMEPIFSISETSDSSSEQLMTMFSLKVLFCSIPVILI